MDNFLDTCVIIANFDTYENHHKKAKDFLENNSGFLICEYQKNEEIPKLFQRKKGLATHILRLMITKNISFEQEEIKIELKKLLSKYSLENPNEENIRQLILILNHLERDIRFFVSTSIKKIIPTCNDRNIIKDLEIANIPDAKIIASALIEHQKNSLTLCTLDKADWEKQKIKRACFRNELVIPQIMQLGK